MRKGKLEERLAPDSRITVSGTEHTREKKGQRTRFTTSAQARNAPSKNKPKKAPVHFAPLPLQQARVLQQLQTFSLNVSTAGDSASEMPHSGVQPARQLRGLALHKKPAVPRHNRLHSSWFDSAGNTDSEVDSPMSQPGAKRSSSVAAHTELNTTPFPPKAPASTPTYCTSADYLAESPACMTMTTPPCGQPPEKSEASPLAAMSCSTADITSANHSHKSALPSCGSPMCMSPDTWGTPQQLQWELSTEGLSDMQQSPQLAPPRAPSAIDSQLQAAHLQVSLDAMKGAAATCSGFTKSRLASSTLADQLSRAASSDGVSDRGFGSFAGDTEWMEDLEVTQLQSPSQASEHECGRGEAGLEMALDCGDSNPQEILGPQVRL